MRIDADEVRLASQGKWRGLYDHFGIDVGGGKHCPCPICPDHGEDRFRCDGIDDDGRYICNQCGAGTAFNLLMKVKGWTFPETIKQINDIVGSVKKLEVNYNKVDPSIALRHLYKTSQPLQPSDNVSKYLRSRGLVLFPNDVRYCPQCYESSTGKKFPAMLAIIRDKDGEGVSIHRTYLNGSKKADLPAPKKTMPTIKPLQGSAIRLFSPKDTKLFEPETLGVAEGIENAIAAAQIFGVATWSCISTAILETFEPPEGIKHIKIFGDNDANFAGQKSAYSLANKLYLKDYLVEVFIPESGDWNEYLERQKI